MADEAPRRNRRLKRISREAAALGVAVCVFCAGGAGLAWAVSAASGGEVEGARDGSAREATYDETYGETYAVTYAVTYAETYADAYGESAGDAAESFTGPVPVEGFVAGTHTEGQSSKKRGSKKKQSSNADEDAADSHEESSTSEADSTSEAESSGEASEASDYVEIEHTKYRRVAVYEAIEHNKGTCRACGAHHDSAYTEKKFKRWREVLCSACGKKHARDYTELVETDP